VLLVVFLSWLATAASIVTLVMFAASGDLNLRTGFIPAVLILLAAYAQFFSRAPLVAAAGLGLQTLVAVFLLVRWRLAQ
jgi:hypothetical protein